MKRGKIDKRQKRLENKKQRETFLMAIQTFVNDIPDFTQIPFICKLKVT